MTSNVVNALQNMWSYDDYDDDMVMIIIKNILFME